MSLYIGGVGARGGGLIFGGLRQALRHTDKTSYFCILTNFFATAFVSCLKVTVSTTVFIFAEYFAVFGSFSK